MLEVDICSAECVCWSSLLVLARIVVVVLTVTVHAKCECSTSLKTCCSNVIRGPDFVTHQGGCYPWRSVVFSSCTVTAKF